MRGTYAKSAQTRARILRSTRALLAEHTGPVPLRLIASRAGMSQAGVLHHFASKAELLLAAAALPDGTGESGKIATALGRALPSTAGSARTATPSLSRWTNLLGSALATDESTQAVLSASQRAVLEELTAAFGAPQDGTAVGPAESTAMRTLSLIAGYVVLNRIDPRIMTTEHLEGHLADLATIIDPNPAPPEHVP